jgi:hypothetical protein
MNPAATPLELPCFATGLGAGWLVWRCPWRALLLVLVVAAVAPQVYRLVQWLVGELGKFVGWLVGLVQGSELRSLGLDL